VLNLFRDQVARSVHLTEEQVAGAVGQLVDERVPAELKADFLCELARKSETPAEIAAFARALRALSVQPPIDPETRAREILDVVGTGGDRLSTFNISTTVAIVCAAAGVTVAKHGNRAFTSLTGSADVLEALGIRVDLSPEEAARWLSEHGFAFFFAPAYHPAFKHIGAARKLCAQRGQRTIFNFLGPLLNPARPTALLVGVPEPELCETLGRVLQSLGARRAMVVSGRVGEFWLDELSTLGESTVAEFYQDRGFAVGTLSPDHFPVQPATLADLRGGDAKVNALIVRRVLCGEDTGPKRDAVLLNAGAALFVAGRVKSVAEGWELALQLVEGGKTRAKLEELIGASRL
jgi:anthranilate phosphoribosyltransferase